MATGFKGVIEITIIEGSKKLKSLENDFKSDGIMVIEYCPNGKYLIAMN
jgi:hypothetical protein